MKCPHCQCECNKVRTHNIENIESLYVMEDSEVYDIVSMYQCQSNKKHVFYMNDDNDNSTENLPLVRY